MCIFSVHCRELVTDNATNEQCKEEIHVLKLNIFNRTGKPQFKKKRTQVFTKVLQRYSELYNDEKESLHHFTSRN